MPKKPASCVETWQKLQWQLKQLQCNAPMCGRLQKRLDLDGGGQCKAIRKRPGYAV